MALELTKLATQVDLMGQAIALRQQEHIDQVQRARNLMVRFARRTDELRQKLLRATTVDASWRGADPLCVLDERCAPAGDPCCATLIATDGSQIYPDRHGIAPYFLLNVSSIVLRQGSEEAPRVETQPAVFFRDDELYDADGRLHDPQYINRERDRRKVARLAELAAQEREACGGDISHPIITLVDGPLLPWMPQHGRDEDLVREVAYLTGQLGRMQHARAVPVGYIDRPGSAHVLRTLGLAELEMERIDKRAVRNLPFRMLADRLLFADLAPNERSGLFASTSEINERYRERGHRIVFYYANMARLPGAENAIIARIEVPEWAADKETIDRVQHALYADCALTGFPYVLARAHELAVVGTLERASLEAMLGQAMWRCGVPPLVSHKQNCKMMTGSRRH